jgi:hypothetical protein
MLERLLYDALESGPRVRLDSEQLRSQIAKRWSFPPDAPVVESSSSAAPPSSANGFAGRQRKARTYAARSYPEGRNLARWGIAHSPNQKRRTDMRTLMRVLPIVAALAGIGGAIYHVTAQGPVRPGDGQVTKPALPSGNILPPSDRYAGNGGGVN